MEIKPIECHFHSSDGKTGWICMKLNIRLFTPDVVVKSPKLWEQIKAFLREHRDEPISRSQVAKVFRISNVYVSELCK